MPDYISNVWKTDIFKDKVVFCTGGNGTICSAQVRGLVYLGANACIVGRNVEKTEAMAKDISTARPGSRVLGIGNVDVRNPSILQSAIDQCVEQLGSIDFLMYVAAPILPLRLRTLLTSSQRWCCGQFPSAYLTIVSKCVQERRRH